MERMALLLGDRIARYHPVGEVEHPLAAALAPWGSVRCTEDRGELADESLSRYALCILYPEFGACALTDAQADALCRFVRTGGGLLTLHNGISVQEDARLAALVGARFTGHPPYSELPLLAYASVAPNHPITRELPAFSIADEAYQFDFEPGFDGERLMEYAYEGGRYPAVWCRAEGLGRVCYIAGGHCARAFESDAFGVLALRAAQWAAGDL